MDDEEPCGFGCSGSFEVLGEAAASAEPGEGAFDDPRRGRSWKPLTPSGRSTIPILHGPQWASALTS
jgi:hypothetical protein